MSRVPPTGAYDTFHGLAGVGGKSATNAARQRAQKAAAPLVDALSTVVGRININAQCGRSPDVVPFSGRRSSAQGTMSVTEALRAFSIETVVAYTAKDEASSIVATGLEKETKLFAPL